MKYYGRVNFTPGSFIAFKVLGFLGMLFLLGIVTLFHYVNNVINPPHAAYTKTIIAPDGKQLQINMPVGTEPNSYTEHVNEQAVLLDYQNQQIAEKKLNDLEILVKTLANVTLKNKIDVAKHAKYSNTEIVSYLTGKSVGTAKNTFLKDAKNIGYGTSYHGYGKFYPNYTYKGYWAKIKSEFWDCDVKYINDISVPKSERSNIVCHERIN